MPALTTVTDTLRDAELDVQITFLTITPNTWWTTVSDNPINQIASTPITVTPDELGEFTVSLVPTDDVSARDGTLDPHYIVSYYASSSNIENTYEVRWSARWDVPTTVSVLTLSDVESSL